MEGPGKGEDVGDKIWGEGGPVGLFEGKKGKRRK